MFDMNQEFGDYDDFGIVQKYSVFHNHVASRSIRAGEFQTRSVRELREIVRFIASQRSLFGRDVTYTDAKTADILEEPGKRDHLFGVFQLASQFNGLEFVSPTAIPERGITIYEDDRTQGPRAAMACPAGTAFRNYFVKMPNGQTGQTHDNQINNLAKLLQKIFPPMKSWLTL